MIPALALGLALKVAAEARRDTILSFDVEAARRAFPDEKLEPLPDPARQAWVRPVVARALARYPTASLVARLDRVYVVGAISYEKMALGGLNDPGRKCLLVALAWVDGGWFERTIHHEFAHTLQDRRKSGFPQKAWRAANAPGFHYGRDGYEAIKSGHAKETYDPVLAAQGVLSEYGGASISEDWATVAEGVMVDDPAFWDYAARFPSLRAKARLAVEFYRRTFPGIRLRDVE